MKKNNPVSDKIFSLSYWHSLETFGKDAVEKVLGQFVWAKKYPAVIQKIYLEGVAVRNQTVLPGEIVYEVAGQSECLYDFYTSEDGEHLYASFRSKPLIAPFDTERAKTIKRQEALMLYGAYCLFKAANVGVGRKGE